MNFVGGPIELLNSFIKRGVVLSLAAAFLTSCEFRLDLTQLSPANISGKLSAPTGYLSMATSMNTCVLTSLSVELYALQEDGDLAEKALLTQPLAADGTFVFSNVYASGVSLSDSSIRYLLKITGCDTVLSRPVTAYESQDITGASTLLALVQGLSHKRPLTQMSPQDVEKIIGNIQSKASDSGDLTDLLNAVIADAGVAGAFQSATQVSPEALKDLPPVKWNLQAPNQVYENSSNAYSVTLLHWNRDYDPAFEWILDGQVVSTQEHWTYQPGKNSQGSHSLEIRIGKEQAGSIDMTKPRVGEQTPVQVVDNTPAQAPVLNLVGAAKRNFLSGSVEILTGPSLIHCETFSALALTESPWVPPLSAASYNIPCAQDMVQTQNFTLSLDDGEKKLSLWARDAAGNISSVSSQVSVILDRTPPAVSLTHPPLAVRGNTSLSISYSGSDALSGLQSLILEYGDGVAPYTQIADVTHTASPHSWNVPGADAPSLHFRLRALDQAGNSSQVLSQNFAIDSVAPVLAITAPGALTPVRTSVSLTGTCEAGFSVQVAGVGASGTQNVACTAGGYSASVALTPGEGTKNITVTQTDAAGNSTSLNRDFIRDNTAPVLAITSHNTNDVVLAAVTFNGTCENGGSDVVISSAALSAPVTIPCTAGNFTSGSLTLTAPDGAKTVSFAQNDVAGNTGTTSLQVVRDGTGPALVVLTPALNAAVQTGVTLTGTCESGTMVEVDGDIASAVSDLCVAGAFSVNVSLTAPDGAKALQLSQEDALGNATTVHWSLVRDNVAPSLTQTQSSPVTNNADTVTFGGACETGWVVAVSGAETQTASCSVGGTWSFATSQTVDGTYAYDFTQTDSAGNSHTVSASWTRDTVAPLTWDLPLANTAAPSQITVSGTCEPGQPISYGGTGLLAGFNGSCAGGGTYSQVLFFSAGEGTKNITVTQTDIYGNVGTFSRNFIRDNTGPVLTQTALSTPSFTNTNSVQFGGACEGTATIDVTLGGASVDSASCSSGSWTWTANQVVDGDYDYIFSQSDAAGNVTSTGSRWTRDTLAPGLVITSSDHWVTASNTVTFSGTCETGLPTAIQVTGEDSATASCSAGSWSYAVAAQSTNTLRTYNFTLTDRAGNSTQVVGTWLRDTDVPGLLITTPNPIINTMDSAAVVGDCQAGEDIEIQRNGVNEGTLSCPGGTFNYTIATQTTDGNRTYSFKQTNTATNGLSTTQTIQWIRDTTPPTLTAGSFALNGNAAVSMKSRVRVSLAASDALTNITHFCLKTEAPAKPGPADACWKAVDGPAVGLTPALALNLSNYGYNLPIVPGTYMVYAWVKDQVGWISDLTNAGVGTSLRDKDDIEYDQPLPPTLVSVLVGSNEYPAEPPSSADLTVPLGTAFYVKWRAIDDKALPAQPMAIYFSQNDSDWTLMADNLSNGSNGGCTINHASTVADDTMTGCYRVSSSPVAGYLKIRVVVKDSDGLMSGSSSLPLNVSDRIQVVAGNTEVGLNLSAQSAMFFTPNSNSAYRVDAAALAVSREGVVFFRDTRGIIKIDPADGLQKLFIPQTGASTGDGGPATQATLRDMIKITLDLATPTQNLWIYDYDRIRRVNLATGIITTVIGGASAVDNADEVNIATQALVSPFNVGDWAYWREKKPFFALPNGDFYFQAGNDGYGDWDATLANGKFRVRYYEASTGRIRTYRPVQITSSSIGNGDFSQCRIHGIAFSYDSSSNILERIGGLRVDSADLFCNIYGTYGALFALDAAGNSIVSPPIPKPGFHGWVYNNMGYVVGQDGKIYAYSKAPYDLNGIYRYDGAALGWTRVVGGSFDISGYCPDGTLATDCRTRVSDVFVTENGTLYYWDQGTIRTIKPDGTILTLMGQRDFTEEGGVPSRQARLGPYNHTFRMANDGRITVLNFSLSKGYDLDPQGDMHHIMGNGVIGEAALGVDSRSTYNNFDNPHSTGTDFAMDPVTGDIWHNAGRWGIAKLTRHSSAIGSSGVFSALIGYGSVNWASNGSEGSSDIDFYNNQAGVDDVNHFGHTPWFLPRVLHYSSGQLLMAKSDMSFRRVDSGWAPRNSMLKLVDTTTGIMRHLSGKQGHVGVTVDDMYSLQPTPGTPVATADHWSEDGDRTLTPYQLGPDRWLIVKKWGKDVWDLQKDGTVAALTTTNEQMTSFTYRQHGSDQYIYYCWNDWRLRRRHIQTGTEVDLPWPVTSMTCSGSALFYRGADQSIVFGFRQNGLAGFAKYFDPM